MPKQGEIILIPVPFSDLSAQKQRPVIVVSNDAYHALSRDMLVVALTSNPTPVPFGFQLTSEGLKVGVLKRLSVVRTDKIYSLSQTLALKSFGEVNEDILERIRVNISELLRGAAANLT